MHFFRMSGEEEYSFRVLPGDLVFDIFTCLKTKVGNVQVVMPGGHLLRQVIQGDPSAILAPFM